MQESKCHTHTYLQECHLTPQLVKEKLIHEKKEKVKQIKKTTLSKMDFYCLSKEIFQWKSHTGMTWSDKFAEKFPDNILFILFKTES